MSFPIPNFSPSKRHFYHAFLHDITPHDPTKINAFVQYADYAAQLSAYKMYFLHGRFQTIIHLHVQ